MTHGLLCGVQNGQVFAGLCPSVGLRVGLAAAQVSVGAEAAAIFGTASSDDLHGNGMRPQQSTCPAAGPGRP